MLWGTCEYFFIGWLGSGFLVNSVMVEMQRTAEQVHKKSFNSPDEIQTYPRTRVESVRVGDQTVKRYTFQPGMRWSQDVKPTVQTPSCELPHMAVEMSGRMRFRMDNGDEVELGPGDVAMIPGGHDKWTVGNEPAVFISFE
jgi:quercetin dioxygenase-like cupin family protein